MNARALLGRRRRPGVALTPKELVVRAGRVVLWVGLAVVLVRGLAAILSTEPAAKSMAGGVAGQEWPDDAARAFAVEFAAVYLKHADGHDPAAAAEALARFASGDTADALAPRVAGHGPGQTIGAVAVSEIERLDRSHALVTVVASVTGAASRLVRLTIPVARDRDGGLAVYDLPALAPEPPRATVEAADGEPLTGAERDAIYDVLTRYFRGYLAGDTGALAYFVPAGTRPAATAGAFELVELASVGALGPPGRDGRLVLATVEARDVASGAVLALRYRVRMVRRDRWYVAGLNRAGGGR